METQTVDSLLQELKAEVKDSADTIITESGEKITPEAPTLPNGPEPMAPEMAKSKTERFVKIRDMLQARVLSHIAKQPEEYKKFQMSAWEIDWLVEVYTDVVGSLGKIPAWLEIVLAEAVILTPKMMQVFDIRKKEMIIQNQAAEIARLKEQHNVNFQPNKTADILPGTDRPDSKKYWQVNNSGYFLYDRSGNYVKAGDPAAEKPNLTPEVYSQLVKYNPQETIDKIFNIQ